MKIEQLTALEIKTKVVDFILESHDDELVMLYEEYIKSLTCLSEDHLDYDFICDKLLDLVEKDYNGELVVCVGILDMMGLDFSGISNETDELKFQFSY